MTELLHLTERPLWEAAQSTGSYPHSTRGATVAEVGFVHLSLRHQLPSVARMLYGDPPERADLVVLVVDDALLEDPVHYEAMAPGGAEFPHLYGALPVHAVVRVEPWPPAADAAPAAG